MKKVKVGIAGCAGFSGLELYKLLSKHPGAEISFITSERFAGKNIKEFLPSEKSDVFFEKLNPKKQANEADVVFFALPAEASLKNAADFYKKSVIIDLSAAFRIKDKNVYQQWYKHEHTEAEILKNAVYGLVEINRDIIKTADIIANPGCYPTSALLPLLPLVKKGYITDSNVIVDSKSGVSGMGRKIIRESTFMEINENFRAYGVGTHRHSPEIEQEVNIKAEKIFDIIFTPHLLPISRGILSTIYIKTDKTSDECNSFLSEYYKDSYFIKVGGENLPNTAGVSNTNFCWFSVKESSKKGTLIIISAIDNLVKGAAGQAIQNFNIRFGFDENTSLV